MPLVFYLFLKTQNQQFFEINLESVYLGKLPITTMSLGMLLAGFFTVAQFSFWGNYLPRVYPMHLRGTGESFAANVGGRMIGTSFAAVTATLAGQNVLWRRFGEEFCNGRRVCGTLRLCMRIPAFVCPAGTEARHGGMISPDEIWELPHRHIGRRVLFFKTARARTIWPENFRPSATHAGNAILAAEQWAGRGIRAAPGKLLRAVRYCSPSCSIPRPNFVALPCHRLGSSVDLRIGTARNWSASRIKWPNDVLVHGRKICGVLIEQGRAIIAGIGLNVNQTAADFESAGLPLAGSLATIVERKFDANEIAKSLLTELDREYDLLVSGDLATLESCWKWRLGLLGREVLAETFDGSFHRGRLRECHFAGLQLERSDGSVMHLIPEQIKAIATA